MRQRQRVDFSVAHKGAYSLLSFGSLPLLWAFWKQGLWGSGSGLPKFPQPGRRWGPALKRRPSDSKPTLLKEQCSTALQKRIQKKWYHRNFGKRPQANAGRLCRKEIVSLRFHMLFLPHVFSECILYSHETYFSEISLCHLCSQPPTVPSKRQPTLPVSCISFQKYSMLIQGRIYPCHRHFLIQMIA